MYDLAMTIYFGMYGATMTTNSELFWGPNSIMMLPYMSSVGDAQSAFFQRMTGLGFAIMSLGYAKCGVSKDAWIKQTMIFHVGLVWKSTSELGYRADAVTATTLMAWARNLISTQAPTSRPARARGTRTRTVFVIKRTARSGWPRSRSGVSCLMLAQGRL